MNNAPGPVEARDGEIFKGVWCIGTTACLREATDKDRANAELWAEAMNAKPETGFTPRQLLEQRDMLLAICREWSDPRACGCDTFRADYVPCRGTCLQARTRIAVAACAGKESEDPNDGH